MVADLQQKNTIFGKNFAMYWFEKISCNKQSLRSMIR